MTLAPALLALLAAALVAPAPTAPAAPTAPSGPTAPVVQTASAEVRLAGEGLLGSGHLLPLGVDKRECLSPGALSHAVVPAHAGIQSDDRRASARSRRAQGRTGLDGRARLTFVPPEPWVPAFAGTTGKEAATLANPSLDIYSYRLGERTSGFDARYPMDSRAPTASGARTAPADVVAAAQRALAGVWADAEVQVVRLSGGAADAAPPLRVQFDDDAPRGRVSAQVLTQTASGWSPAGWAFLDVAVYESAAVLTADVARGESLDGALRLQRVDATRLDAVRTPDQLAGWVARRTLDAGTVVTDRLAEPPPAVQPREPLRVRYDRGAVRVVLDCLARERGAVGETVRATCADTRSSYRVRLTAPGEGDWTGTL